VKRPNGLSAFVKTAIDDDRGFPIEPSDEPAEGNEIASRKFRAFRVVRRVARPVP
jgi:hypothetical protein